MPFTFHRRELPPLSVPRAGAAAVGLAGGRVAVIGGATRGREEGSDGACEVGCRSSAAVDVIDVARGLVVPGPPLRAARESAHAAAFGGRILVMGGIADYG
jgi:hypothetical protein